MAMSDSPNKRLPVDPAIESAATEIVQGLVFECEHEERRKKTQRVSLKRVQRIASAFTEPNVRHSCNVQVQTTSPPHVYRLVRRQTAEAVRSIAMPSDPPLVDEYFSRREKKLAKIKAIQKSLASEAHRNALLILAQVMSFVALFALIHMLGSLTGFVLFLGSTTIAYESVISARRF